MKRWIRALVPVLALLVVVLLAGCASTQQTTDQAKAEQATSETAEAAGESTAEETTTPEESEKDKTATLELAVTGDAYVDAWEPREGLTLKQVVAVSRHNLRAPLEDTQELIASATPHTWTEWSAGGSQLTSKGGVDETIMGTFFRKWLEREGLIPANYIPGEGEVRIYANPRQRTLATAQFFATGMLPVGGIEVEYHGDFDTRDPVFKPRFDIATDSYVEAATAEIAELGGDAGIAGIDAGLEENYRLLEDVYDYQDSEGYRSGELKDLVCGDTTYDIALDAEPKVGGSLSLGNTLADALVLQFYEADTISDASFGHDLTWDEWLEIEAIKSTAGDGRFDSELVACDCAHLLAQEVASELAEDGRVFSFLCGHDSNQASLLHALGVTDYTLPDTIEVKEPIGGKILFERWEDKEGNAFANIRYVYATSEQVRDSRLLSLAEPPASYDLEFEGIERGENGLFALADVEDLLAHVQATYESLEETYPDVPELAEAA